MPRIPPLALVVGCAVLMAAVDRFVPFEIDFPGRLALAVLLAAGALVFAALAALTFRRAGTTVDPRDPARASALVTGGPFRLSRNPMYVAFAAALLALALALGNPLALAFVVLFIAWMDRVQIPAEEKALRANFGAAFEEYARGTRRWL